MLMQEREGSAVEIEETRVLDAILARLAASERAAHLLIPLMRAYLRYAPFTIGKRSLWTHVIEPHFAWESHEFVGHTIFGDRIAGDTREIIQQYIYYFGVWEPHLTRWINQRLAPGDTFIDIGANIGYYSLLASRLVGASGAVIAIEASPQTFSALEANLARNRARNVRAVNIAVSDSVGTVKLFRGPETNIGVTTIFEEEGLKWGCEFECEIESAPLSAILRPDEMKNARLIKIDVEGAEWAVVAGMSLLLSSGRADLEAVVEMNPERLAQQGKQPEDILEIFRVAGFHAYCLENDYSPLNYLPPYIEKRPARIRAPIECEVDVLFSRREMELL